MNEIEALVNAVQSVGLWAVFLYLYLSEKRAHELTRESYRRDLREVAGFTSNSHVTINKQT